MDVEGIIECAGLTPHVLTRAEASHAKATPDIERTIFNRVFGGNMNSEWPQCPKVPGYEDFLCTGITAQPFMPLVAGKPGLLLRLPAVVETPQSNRDRSTFHVLSATLPNGALHYRGKYRKISLPQIQFIWTKLSEKRVRLSLINNELMLKPRLHIMGVLTLFSLRKDGATGSENHPPCVPFVHA
jgi:hypothetical protein